MIKPWILFGYAISLTLSHSLFAQSANCTITVLSERNSGEKIRVNFVSTLHSKQECKALAQMHYPNFNPDQTKSKTVSYKWSGGNDSYASLPKAKASKKHASSLAVASSRNRQAKRHR